MGAIPLTGKDSWNSWRIAVTCGAIHLLCTLALSSLGNIFAGILEDFKSERERASWPITAFTSTMQMCSPLYSLIIHFGVSHTSIMRVATFVVAASLALCYFANEIMHLTILLAIHGTGIAGMFVSANVIMAPHFDKMRTAATGVQEAITGFSLFFMPVLMDKLINEHRTSRALFLLGLVSFLCFILSLCVSAYKEKHKSADAEQQQPEDFGKRTSTGSTELAETPSVIESQPTWKILLTPIFFLDTFSFLVVFECVISFLQITIDYSNDVQAHQAGIWLTPIYGIGDIIFKLMAGMLSDFGYVSPAALMLIGSLIQCLAFVGLSFSTSFATLGISAFLIGAANGCRIFLFIIILINDFGMDKLAHTFSFANFYIGAATLLKPFVVGYFRDYLGQYLGLILCLATINAIAATYWAWRLRQQRKARL